MADTTTKVKIKGEDLLTPELKKINKSLEDLNKTNLTKLAVSFDAVTEAARRISQAVSKVYSECAKLVTEYATVERYNNRLAAVWENVGKATGKTAEEMLAFADSIEKVTFFEAESVQTAAQTLAAIQTLNGEGFEKAVSLSVDLAEAMGIDVPNAASVLARALIAPEEGLGRLKTIGVGFSETEKELITQLQADGKIWESQQIILDKVAEKYEGIAKAVADTDTNKLTQISNTLGSIREALGETLLDVISPALDRLYARLQKIEAWANRKAKTTAVEMAINTGSSLSDLSDEGLLEARNNYQRNIDLNLATQGYSDFADRDAVSKIDAEFARREKLIKRQMVENRQNDGVSLGSVTDATSIAEAATSAGQPVQHLIDKVVELGETSKATFSQVADSITGLFTAATNLITSSVDSQVSALEKEMETMKENGTLTVEEERKKQDEINKLKKKAFEADKANSIANALISGAEAVVKFLANPGGPAGVALSAASTVTTGLQVAAINQQQFTPMATGGIVTSPTHALIGEAGPEAIIPLTKGRNPLENMSGVTINITVEGNADEDVIFNAIERAQRTGLLPAWRYAN